MIRTAKSLIGYTLCATDGEMGRLEGFYFDQDTWTIRYLLMRSGNWLMGRQVLISPIAIGGIDDGKRLLQVQTKRFRVGNSPSVNINRPISRQYEVEFHRYYGWPLYWGAAGRWGDDQLPSDLFAATPAGRTAVRIGDLQRTDFLSTTNRLKGLAVFAGDMRLGTVEDFLIDDRSWALRYLLIRSEQPNLARTVPVSPHWIDVLSDEDRIITLGISPDAIAGAPPYERPADVTPDFEETLFKHYGYDRVIDEVHVRRSRVPA